MKNVVSTAGRDKLFNFRPALFAAFFLIFGIIFSYYRLKNGISFQWLTAAIPVGVIPLACSGDLKVFHRRGIITLLFIAIFAVGFVCFRSQVYAYGDAKSYHGRAVVTGTVELRNPEKNKLTLTDISIDGKEVDGRMTVYLSAGLEELPRVADRVVLQGDVRTDKSLFNGYGFRSSAIHKNLYYACYTERTEVIAVGRSNNLFLLLRSRMEQVIYAGMDETPAALTLALLTGDSTGMAEELNANMRYGGISHIFAVSGLNVGALFAFCLLVFTKTGLKRLPKPVRFLIVVGILFFYCGVCGFSASVVRAAVLCSIGYFVRLLLTGYDLLNALGIAAIFILLLSPCQLFDVGFQLSFLACVGLFLLARPIAAIMDEGRLRFRRRFPRKLTKEEKTVLERRDALPPTVSERIWRWCVALISASIAAQIATAPVLLIRFGYLSGWSLLLNFIFVPFTDAFFTVLLVLTVIACCLPALFAPIFLYLPSVVWSAAMLVFEVADFSSFALKNVQLSLGICVCYYGGLTFLSDKWNLSKRLKGALALLCFLGVGISLIFTA